MFTIDEVLSQSNQKSAFEHLKTRRDGHGPDGMQLSELEEYWQINGEDICQKIKLGDYRPGVIQIKEFLEKGNAYIVEIDITDFFDTISLPCKIFKRNIKCSLRKDKIKK